MSLVSRIQDLATRMSTEDKSLRTLINGNLPSLSALTTTAKDNLVNAINEVNAKPSGGAAISDGTTTTTSTWSSNKITSYVQAVKDNLVNGAGTALDQLNELAAALGNDPNFSTTIMTALGLRVRVDAAQSLSATQQTQARSNISVYSTTEIGNPETNFVTIYESGLV